MSCQWTRPHCHSTGGSSQIHALHARSALTLAPTQAHTSTLMYTTTQSHADSCMHAQITLPYTRSHTGTLPQSHPSVHAQVPHLCTLSQVTCTVAHMHTHIQSRTHARHICTVTHTCALMHTYSNHSHPSTLPHTHPESCTPVP